MKRYPLAKPYITKTEEKEVVEVLRSGNLSLGPKVQEFEKQFAKKIGTKQSVISRLESGRANPSVAFLKKLASALNSHLQIKFVSR